MRKTLLSIAVLSAAICAQAQSSLESALDIVEGMNTANAQTVEGMSYRGAYFKYTAPEATMLSLTGVNGSTFYFYKADGESNYDYLSSHDENYVYTYSVRVEAGETSYVFASLSWGSTDENVSFNAAIAQGDYLNHGATADDRVEIVSGTTYFFKGEGYLTYFAEQEGELQLHQSSYSYGASYTVDGVTTEFGFEDNQASIPVAAGKHYDINVSSYGMFSLSAVFAQPSQGDTKDNPFILAFGDNTLPAAAQKYYFRYTNGDLAGFLTLTADDVTLAARDIQSGYDNLASGKKDLMRLELSAGQEILITVDKAVATDAAQVLTATFAQPEQGDIEGNPIVLTPSETEVIATAKGVKFYQITNPSDDPQFLCINVLSEGVGPYESSNVKVYKQGDSYQWSGTSIESGSAETLQVAGNAVYMIYVNNTSDADLQFSVWFQTIGEGDVYAKPIAATLGQNAAPAGQKYFAYTTTQQCKLRVLVDETVATAFFPNYDGDDYYGKDLLSQDGGEYVLAANAGQDFIIRITASEATTFTIEEVAYGEGQSRSTAIAFDGTYVFDDLNPYDLWLVYTAPKAGIAVLNANLEGVSYDDNIQYVLNDTEMGYASNLRGYDADYNTVMLERTLAVSEGDRIYIHIDVKSYQEGKTLTVIVRDAEPGEAPSNPILIDSAEPVALAGVAYSDPEVWYTFTTLEDGDLTFTSTQYVKLALYDSELNIIPAGQYSDEIYTGDYYDAVTVTLAAGTYYLAVMTNTDNAELTLTGVELWNGQSTSIASIAERSASARTFRMDGAQAAANAVGLLIKDGKLMFVK